MNGGQKSAEDDDDGGAAPSGLIVSTGFFVILIKCSKWTIIFALAIIYGPSNMANKVLAIEILTASQM